MTTFDRFPTTIRYMLAVHANFLRLGFDPADLFVVFGPYEVDNPALAGGVVLKDKEDVVFEKKSEFVLTGQLPIRAFTPCGPVDGFAGEEGEAKLSALWNEAIAAWNSSSQPERDDEWHRFMSQEKFNLFVAQAVANGLLTVEDVKRRAQEAEKEAEGGN